MLIAEVRTRAFLASIVPVIVNAVLNEHQLVLDIVAFVALGDFPRSRLGEKQRGKVLANWVSRKMRTMAQFSIRDLDSEGSVGTIGPGDVMGRRSSAQSSGKAEFFRQSGGGGGGTAGSSLRHAESLSHMPVAEEEPEVDETDEDYRQTQLDPSDPQQLPPSRDRAGSRSDITPTNETPRRLPLNTTLDYSPVEPAEFDSPVDQLHRHAPPTSDFDFGLDHSHQHHSQREVSSSPASARQEWQPQQHVPGLDSYEDVGVFPHGSRDRGIGRGVGGGGGGLRIANNTQLEDHNDDEEEEEGAADWEQDALRSLNLAR